MVDTSVIRSVQRIRLKSWNEDYLGRLQGPQGVTSVAAGGDAEWVLEQLESGKVRLRSSRGDYLERAATGQGVTTGTGTRDEWTIEPLDGGKIGLRSSAGDCLHRPEAAQGVTTWGAGPGNVWTLEPMEAARAVVQSPVLEFGAPGQVVDIGLKPEHKIKRDITIEAWVYPTRHDERAGILSRIYDTGATESGYGLLLDGASGLYFGVRTATNQNFYFSSGPNTLKLHTWQHVAATYDGQKITLYIDGQEKGTGPMTGDIDYDPENGLSIGAFRDNDESRGFPGRLAEVRLWSVARTIGQLRTDMVHRLTGSEANLVGYWPLDEGTGTLARDRTPRGHHGTLTGPKWVTDAIPFAAPPLSTPTAPGPARKPNVLLIIADDCGVDLMRINKRGEVIAQIDGPEGVHTGGQRLPNIEKLVKHGVRFTQAWAHPVCAPSRASVFTGLHPWRHGVGFPADDCILPEFRPGTTVPIRTMGEVLSEAGYRCGMFGKWDLGAPTPGVKRTAMEWGWTRFEGLIGGGVAGLKSGKYWYPDVLATGADIMKLETLDSTEVVPGAPPHALSERQQVKAKASEYLKQAIPDYLEAQRDIRYYVYKKDIEDRDASIRRYATPPTERTHLYATKDHFLSAREWIKHNYGRTWSVALTSIAPHTPYHIPPQESFRIQFADPKKPTTQELLIAQLQSLDYYIGEILNSPDPEIREQLKNTVIIFVADNGTQDDDPDTRTADGAGDTIDDDRQDKGTFYIGGCHVPLVIADGGSLFAGEPCYLDKEATLLGKRSVCAEPVHIVDLFSTCVEIAGGTPPADLDAVSLVPHLRTSTGQKRTYNFSQQFAPFGRRVAIHASISDGQYKLSCVRTRFVDGSEADDYAYNLFILDPHDRIPGALRETPIQDFYDDDVHLAAAKRLYAELERQHLTPGHQPKNLPPLKFPGLKIPEVAAYRYVRLIAKSEVAGGPWASVADFHVLADGRPLDRTKWTVKASSEETNGLAKAAVDGSRATMWHTKYNGSLPKHPHWLQIDMQAPQRISGFRYQPRQEGQNGRIADYEFQVSNDSENWTTLCSGRFPNTTAEQTVSVLAPNKHPGQSPGCRYVRLIAMSEVGGKPWTAVEDFQLLLDGKPLDRSDWGVTVDSFEADGELAPAHLAIDGTPGTYWHSQWQKQAPRHPHWLSVDMQTPRMINGFRYQPRTAKADGRIAEYELQVSNDGQNWATVNTGRFSGTAEAQTASFKLPRHV